MIELDLLRSGKRLFPYPELDAALAGQTPRADYVVVISRSWKRTQESQACQISPVAMSEPLSCIPVPLRQGEAEVPLDLQFVFRRVYDTGPYHRGAVDYSAPPGPPLPADMTSWAEECLRAAAIS